MGVNADSGPLWQGARSFFDLENITIGFSIKNGFRIQVTLINIKKFVLSWTLLILVYHIIPLPLDRVSVKTANTCYQSIFDGSKIEKIKILVNFSHFWTFWAPLLGPQGSSFSLFHSLQLSPRQISVKITKVIYLSEMDGGKILKIQGFGQFWPFLVL